MIHILSVREHPEYVERVTTYLQQSWSDVWPVLYSDSVGHCVGAQNPLPQWYVLEKEGEWIGCAGLITNDFISRMDLYPWFCALFIDPSHRGHRYGKVLIDKAKEDAKQYGFDRLYLCTDHIGYYEKYGFSYIGDGYHPWQEKQRIYKINLY